MVRTANAFAVDTVHIVGRRRWNRRGAMVTDRYQRLTHHDATEDLLAFAAHAGLTVVAVDNVPGATRLERTELPHRSLLLFGSEGPGISEAATAARRWWSPSPSSVRPAASTPPSRRVSRCTPGSVDGVTSTLPGREGCSI